MKTEYKIYIFFLILRFSKRLDCVSFQHYRPYPCGKCSEPGFTFLCKKNIDGKRQVSVHSQKFFKTGKNITDFYMLKNKHSFLHSAFNGDGGVNTS